MRVEGQDDSGEGSGFGSAGPPEALPQVPPQGARHRAGDAAPGPASGPASGPAAGDPPAPTVPHPGGPVDDEPLPVSDAELTAAVRGGDDAAYEELYRRHADAVRRYARTCCRDTFTAEDLAGEVFARTLQALRAGKGPEIAVRAYLLTAVRNIAAGWSRSDRREQLVDDFTLFASTSAAVADVSVVDPGADAWAMAGIDHSLVVRAFSRLEPDDQMVLWHTAVEREPPRQVAELIGKSANATAVQASRARDRLATEFLQAHISDTQETACEAYARRLGAFARGSLGKRAAGDVRGHMKECDRCSAAYLELVDLNHSLRELLPTGALVWWVGSGYFTVLAAGAAGAAGVAAGVGGAAGAGAAGAGAGSSGGAAGGGAAEGLGVPAKAGIAALVTVVAVAGVVFALSGSDTRPKPPQAAKPSAVKVVPGPAALRTPRPTPSPAAAAPKPATAPVVRPAPRPALVVKVSPKPRPKPTPMPTPKPTQTPKPTPKASPRPVPRPTPPVVTAADYYVDALPYSGIGAADGPSVAPDVSSWLWQRGNGVRVGGTSYPRGITVRAPSSVTVDLNRQCSEFAAAAGVDDMTLGLGAVRFKVLDAATGRELWSSGVVRGGQAAVPVDVPLQGVSAIRLVTEPAAGSLIANVADWANARFTCH